jgi:hypothetical protein
MREAKGENAYGADSFICTTCCFHHLLGPPTADSLGYKNFPMPPATSIDAPAI